MTLLKEYYSVAMSICWYTMSNDCLSYYVGHFMLVYQVCIQPVQLALWVGVLSCGDTPVNVVSC